MSDRDHMLTLGQRIATQNNRATADPIFVVQERRRLYGLDPDYCDNVVWIDQCNDSAEATPGEHAKLEADYEDSGIEPLRWARTGYIDQWHFVTACLTEQGAKEYLKDNGHNLRGETRIYAESCYRNAEMISVRRFLRDLPPATVESVADGTREPRA